MKKVIDCRNTRNITEHVFHAKQRRSGHSWYRESDWSSTYTQRRNKQYPNDLERFSKELCARSTCIDKFVPPRVTENAKKGF